MSFWRRAVTFLKRTCLEFSQDNCSSMAAALAYYAVFSISPLVLITVVVAGSLYGEEQVRTHLQEQLTDLFGKAGSEQITTMLRHAHSAGKSRWATVASFAALFIGATAVMVQLQTALNQVWGKEPSKKRGMRGLVIKRALSFVMVLVVAIVFLASLILTTVLTAAMTWLKPYLPGDTMSTLMYLGHMGVTLLITIVLLAALFRWIPDARVHWSDVWVGATVTGLLFMLGKELLGWYLGSRSVGAYGGAGALILLLMWVHYTSLILLFGAEFTQVWAESRGHQKRPLS